MPDVLSDLEQGPLDPPRNTLHTYVHHWSVLMVQARLWKQESEDQALSGWRDSRKSSPAESYGHNEDTGW